MRAVGPLFVALVVLAATGCGGGGDGTVRLTAEDSGRAVEVRPGGAIEITLAATPGTGFGWAVAANEDPRVLLVTPSEVRPKTTTAPLGAPGTQVWRLDAVAAGTTTVKLVYARSWEPEKAVQTFSLRVRVR